MTINERLNKFDRRIKVMWKIKAKQIVKDTANKYLNTHNNTAFKEELYYKLEQLSIALEKPIQHLNMNEAFLFLQHLSRDW